MPRPINTSRTSNSTALKDGVYQLLIVDSDEAVSKSGNEMVVLTLQAIKGRKNLGREIKDYMVYPEEDLEEGEQDKYSWKFDQLHNALDLEEGKVIDYRYYEGKKLFASLVTDIYGDRVNNKIDKYLPEDVALELISQQQEDIVPESDDLEEGFAPVKKDAAKRGRPSQQRAAVAEMDDDDLGMPL